IAALQRPFDVEGRENEIAISIGIAVSPQHGEDAETLMRRADMAMYVAKRTPGGSAVYAEQEDPEGSNQLALMAELRHTLEADQLHVVYQPIVGFGEGEAMRVEALARWRHPSRGLGVQVAIDDFGVGYSSLAYLQRLPAYAVKIDRSFVGRMTRDRGSAEIVKLITTLGHALGMKVVAEGIENQATYDACAAAGC